MTFRSRWAAGVLAPVLLVSCAPPQHTPRQQIDPQLAAEIDGIRAIDNHAHPVRVVNENETDTEYDALPVALMEAYDSVPLRARGDNPELTGAWRDLFRFRHEDMRPESVKQALELKHAARKEHGDRYDTWVLDQLKIDVMLANRVAMGRGLDAARFKWVPYGDALMYPLSNESLGRRDPDRKAFFGAEDKLLHRLLGEASLNAVPASLDDYLRFVTATLERWKSQNAVAVKLEMAYLRSFDVGNPARTDVERTFQQYAKGGEPGDADYKTVQDFLFRHIARECGRLGLPIHLHSCAGAGRYYDIPGANPTLLAPVIEDMAMKNTRFVLVHGGWPYVRETTAMLMIPNVYADFSAQDLFLYPRALSDVIRGWLEFVPEKVLYATDASPWDDRINWEESGWLADRTARDAVGLALTGMLRDREISRERASELARMVMRDNARRLYGFR